MRLAENSFDENYFFGLTWYGALGRFLDFSLQSGWIGCLIPQQMKKLDKWAALASAVSLPFPIQGSTKWLVHDCVKFVPALGSFFCLIMPWSCLAKRTCLLVRVRIVSILSYLPLCSPDSDCSIAQIPQGVPFLVEAECWGPPSLLLPDLLSSLICRPYESKNEMT